MSKDFRSRFMPPPGEKSQGNSLILIGALKFTVAAALVGVLLRTAWASDDAFISFRVVSNFLNGYGLRWNVDDRVQVYTDPLFVFLIAFCTWITGNVYLAAMGLSLVLTVATFFAISWGASKTGIVIASAILLFSKGFMDFSVSGMENPLTDFTVALFLLTFWHRPRVLALSFIAALSAVNRMDTALFFLPALSLVYWRAGWRAWKDILLDWSPFLAWCAFSVFYYGFLFPNTAYAKLYTGIPATATWHQGLLYYLNAVRSDTVTVLAIGAGLAIAFRHREYLIASGVLAYLLYVVGVGGDFMSSRFFTAPLVMATMLILRFWKPGPWSAAAALAAVVIGGLSVSTPTLLSTGKNFTVANPVDLSGIANERAAYNPWTGLQNYRSDPLWPDHPSSKAGHEAKLQRRKVVPYLHIGMFGYQAGPGTHIIDQFGLGDAFLARLPKRPGPWRVGHYGRDLPEGYQATLETGVNQISDPRLAEFYRHLHVLIGGSVWNPGRLREIYNFNIGRYSKSPL